MSLLTKLQQELTDLDSQHRLLSQEVNNLETALAAQQMMSGSDDAGEHQLTKTQKLEMPEEFYSDLIAKAGEVNVLMQHYKTLKEQQKTTAAALPREVKEVAQLERDLQEMYDASGWKPGGKLSYKCPIQAHDEVIPFKQETLRLLNQRQVLEKALSAQTEDLERLSKELQGFGSAEAQIQEGKTLLATKEVRLAELKERIAMVKRVVQKQDRVLAIDYQPKVRAAIRNTENDKRCMHSAYMKKYQTTQDQEDLIRYRALQIARLQRRLELYADAIGGDDTKDIPEDGREVDMQIVEEVRQEVKVLLKMHGNNEQKLLNLDVDVEDLDLRVDALRGAEVNAVRRGNAVWADHARYMNAVDVEMVDQQTYAEEVLAKLELEVGDMEQGKLPEPSTKPGRLNTKKNLSTPVPEPAAAQKKRVQHLSK